MKLPNISQMTAEEFVKLSDVMEFYKVVKVTS